MKILIVLFMAFAVTTGAYAQFTVNGQFHTHFHSTFWAGDDGHAAGNFAQADPQWNFGFLTSQTWLQVGIMNQQLQGWMRVRANGTFRAFIWGNGGVISNSGLAF